MHRGPETGGESTESISGYADDPLGRELEYQTPCWPTCRRRNHLPLPKGAHSDPACALITPEVPACGGRPLFEDTTTRARGPRFPDSNSKGQTIFSCETAERFADRGATRDHTTTQSACGPETQNQNLHRCAKRAGEAKDTSNRRCVVPKPAADASLISLPRLSGLHNRYVWRRAA